MHVVVQKNGTSTAIQACETRNQILHIMQKWSQFSNDLNHRQLTFYANTTGAN